MDDRRMMSDRNNDGSSSDLLLDENAKEAQETETTTALNGNSTTRLLGDARYKDKLYKNTLDLKTLRIHAGEFPSRLQPVLFSIKDTNETPSAQNLRILEEIVAAVHDLFIGLSVDEETLQLKGPHEWHGLDDRFDTEEQAATVLWCGAAILQNKIRTRHATIYPIHLLLSHPHAVSFVPLFLKFGDESVRKKYRNNVLEFLLTHRCKLPGACGRVQGSALFGHDFLTPELSANSLRVLVRLRNEDKILTNTDIHKILMPALLRAIARGHEGEGTLEFFETRLRLLANWVPDVLKRANMYDLGTAPVAMFAACHHADLFEVALDLGMKYFPLQLGFCFHQSNLDGTSHAYLGSDTVTSIFRNCLSKRLAKNEIQQQEEEKFSLELMDLLLAAATNDSISIDGVYTILRYDPAKLLKNCNATKKE